MIHAMPSAGSVILVVEDEWLVREVIVQELRDAGYIVLEAASGDEALPHLEGGDRIDLLFTDIRFPGKLDGWQLAQRARELRPALPVLYATGYSSEEPPRLSHSEFLRKPYRSSAILDTIEQLIAASEKGAME